MNTRFEHLANLLTNIRPENIPVAEQHETLTFAGRRSLRVSITRRCNLECSHCHNEGQEAPWLGDAVSPQPTIAEIDALLRLAGDYAPSSVKFTGGEPGLYTHLQVLLANIESWRQSYPSALKWGMSTNGIPFLSPHNYRSLAQSSLDNISVGIDSIEPGEISKPSSGIGLPGGTIITRFIERLRTDCPDKSVKINVVFTGHRDRAFNVIRVAHKMGIDVSVIELNRVMEARPNVRTEFFHLLDDVANEFRLQPRQHAQLNEIYLYERGGAPTVRFYQDHCTDLDCGHCRAIHLRVGYTSHGWTAHPCFLQNQANGIPLAVDGILSKSRFEDALRLNGRGPTWCNNTPYQRDQIVTLGLPK